jgi:hypothetical protein
MTDKELLMAANLLALSVRSRAEHGATVEELWMMLSLAARLTERGVIHACQVVGGLGVYRDAQERLARLEARSDAASDETDAEMGTPPEGKA